MKSISKRSLAGCGWPETATADPAEQLGPCPWLSASSTLTTQALVLRQGQGDRHRGETPPTQAPVGPRPLRSHRPSKPHGWARPGARTVQTWPWAEFISLQSERAEVLFECLLHPDRETPASPPPFSPGSFQLTFWRPHKCHFLRKPLLTPQMPTSGGSLRAPGSPLLSIMTWTWHSKFNKAEWERCWQHVFGKACGRAGHPHPWVPYPPIQLTVNQEYFFKNPLSSIFLFTTGDWNAKIGSQEIPGVTGKFGLGIQNEAEQRLTVLPREHIAHSKHPLPTTQEKTLNMDITRWSILKSDWLYSLQSKVEKLYTVSKNMTGSWLWLRSWTPYCKTQA